MKRKDFDKTQVVKKYRKSFAKAQSRQDKYLLIRLNLAKKTLEDDKLRKEYDKKCDKYQSKDGL